MVGEPDDILRRMDETLNRVADDLHDINRCASRHLKRGRRKKSCSLSLEPTAALMASSYASTASSAALIATEKQR